MRILILGGSGFIGPRIPAALERLDHEGLIVSRTSKLSADRNDPASVARLAAREHCDALIDVIALEPRSTLALRDAVRERIGRYVLISSADVYRNYGGLHRIETPEPIAMLTEESPRRTVLYPYRKTPPRAPDDPQVRMDSYDKIPIEDALAAPDATVIRLPMVYGPGDRNRRFRWIIAPMLARTNAVTAPAAWLDWVTTYGHVDDVAAAIALCATHPQAGGRTYHCGEPPVSHRVWIERFAAALNWRGGVKADDNAPIAPMVAAVNLAYPLALDTARVRAELGFTEMLTSDEALQSVISEEQAP